MNQPEVIFRTTILRLYYGFIICLSLTVLLMIPIIIMKCCEKNFARRVVGQDSHLEVQCIRSQFRHPAIRIGFFIMLLVVAIGFLVDIAMRCDFSEMSILIGLAFCATVIYSGLVFMFGQIIKIGPNGLCYPITGFHKIFLPSKDRSYDKLKSMEYAVIRKRSIRIPSKSILEWEWFEEESLLILIVYNKNKLFGSGPQRVTLYFPKVNESEQEAIVEMLERIARSQRGV